MPTDTLDNFLSQIKGMLTVPDSQSFDSDIPDEPEGFDPKQNRIQTRKTTFRKPLPPSATVEEIRASLPQYIYDYVQDKKQKTPLVVSVPAGIGKTYTGIEVAQNLAAQNKRVLWLAANHDMFNDLSRHDNFTSSLWYHWQSVDGTINDQPACKYPMEQHRWTELGYKSRVLCFKLCGRGQDPWIQKCPYRCQKAQPEPIVFGMHQHLFTGIDAKKFDVCFVDENFISCIVKERVIPPDAIKSRAPAAIELLLDELFNCHLDLVYRRDFRGKPDLRGKELFDRIGYLFADARAQMDFDEDAVLSPQIISPSDVENLPYFFLPEMAKVGAPELAEWEKGTTNWAERIWIARDGLHIIPPVKVWENLPRKTIILDATANIQFYNHVFRAPCVLYKPNVQRKGRLYQVAGRMYHKGGMTDKSFLQDAIDTVKGIVSAKGYQNFGIICSLNAERAMIETFGFENVLHFYKLRGRNDYNWRDAVFVVGTPSPNANAIINIALALRDDTTPIYERDPDGNRKPLVYYAPREFVFSEHGENFIRQKYGDDVCGVERRAVYYQSDVMRAVQMQLRESELVQAIHRARLNTRQADVWLLSSIPTDEPLDEIYNEPPISPEGIPWQIWMEIQAWMNELHRKGEVMTAKKLADATGVSEGWIRRNRWLSAIADWSGGQWETVNLPSQKGGRPLSAIRRSDLPL